MFLRFVLASFAPVKLAPIRFVSVKFAFVRSDRLRCAPVRFAPVISALLRPEPINSTQVRSQPRHILVLSSFVIFAWTASEYFPHQGIFYLAKLLLNVTVIDFRLGWFQDKPAILMFQLNQEGHFLNSKTRSAPGIHNFVPTVRLLGSEMWLMFFRNIIFKL